MCLGRIPSPPLVVVLLSSLPSSCCVALSLFLLTLMLQSLWVPPQTATGDLRGLAPAEQGEGHRAAGAQPYWEDGAAVSRALPGWP